MARYYFNENPQVEYWMGKCAMLEKEIALLHENLEDAILEFNSLSSAYREMFSISRIFSRI